jgi:hypothetical protein
MQDESVRPVEFGGRVKEPFRYVVVDRFEEGVLRATLTILGQSGCQPAALTIQAGLRRWRT